MTDPMARAMRRILLHSRHSNGISIHDVMQSFGETSIELWLLVFAVLSCLPLAGIPGYTTVTGLPVVFFGAQLCMGRKSVWLPKFIMQKRISSPRIAQTIKRSLPYLRKIERRLKPRFTFLTEKPWLPLYGAIFVIVGGLLALPIPFINFPCAFILFLLAAGLVSTDGRMIIAVLVLLLLGIIAGISLLVWGAAL